MPEKSLPPAGPQVQQLRRIAKLEELNADLLAVCESAVAKMESDLSGEMRLNESHLYDMRAAITKAKP